MQKNVSTGNRFLGWLIDVAVLYAFVFIFGLLAAATNIGVLAIIGIPLGIGYFLLRDALFGGQSIGKKVMKYKAVKEDGSSLAGDYKLSLLRNISLVIPIVCLIDYVFVITDKARLGDNWAKTKVESL